MKILIAEDETNIRELYLVDTLEDTTVFEQLSPLNVDIKRLKSLNPNHAQLTELLDGLTSLHTRQNIQKIIIGA